MTSSFTVVEHIIVSSYVREYAFATVRDQEDKLRLHVKQYVPRKHDHTTTSSSSVTIIACGALGFPKETYEPFWEELYQQSQSCNFSIRGIWMMDPANMGLSSTMNEGKLGDDPSWIDHTRDSFLLINHFRDQMPRPLVGIGHSFGGVQLINLALFHPRLFSSLILLDPYITRRPPPNFRGSPVFNRFLVDRQATWPSRSSAEADIAKWPIYYGFDPRCLAALLKYGLRTLKTPDNSTESADPPVTWTTLAAQEVHTMSRPTRSEKQADGTYIVDSVACPDLDPLDAWDTLYRWEIRGTLDRIGELRPSARFVLGAKSYVPLDEVRMAISQCGRGRSGSGGIDAGRVTEVEIAKAGHFFPLQLVERTAKECAPWIDQEVQHWSEQERRWKEERDLRLQKGERIGLELSPRMREILDQEKAKRRAKL